MPKKLTKLVLEMLNNPKSAIAQRNKTLSDARRKVSANSVEKNKLKARAARIQNKQKVQSNKVNRNLSNIQKDKKL